MRRYAPETVAMRSLFLAAALTPACILPISLHAQLVPTGSEFQVNSYTTDDQAFPKIAAAINGDFVVVWDSEGIPGPDGDLAGIFGQRYADNGAVVGTEFQVNTYTTSSQARAAVAAASNGDFVVVWDSYGQDGSSSGVFGQRYASDGSVLGTEFQVNTYTTSAQRLPAVAAASNGDFVVVWQSDGQDGSLFGVFGQRYDSAGSALGTEFQVNTYTTAFQGLPAVAVAGSGDFLVVWRGDDQDGFFEGVFGQRYTSSGSALGTEFRVNTYTTSSQVNPAVAAASNGDFVVVWVSYGQDGSNFGIFGQRYAGSGGALGTEFQVNTYTTGDQFHPAVAAGDGDFTVVWQSYGQDGSDFGVFGRRYASSGSALGTEFRVNTYTPNAEYNPAIVASNGHFVVVWESYSQDGSYYGVFGQRFTAVPPSPGCASTPLAGCTTPGKSLLLIQDKSPAGASAKDKLTWKWLKGPATMQTAFGDPTSTTAYHFCVYAGTAQSLVVEADVPADGTCGDAPCWKSISAKGYKYNDTTASAAGISRVLLKGGIAGKILLKGKDGHLDLTPDTLPLAAADVLVQLGNSDNLNCWQATFPTASVKKTTDAEFKAKTP